jgi:hypothetical protein
MPTRKKRETGRERRGLNRVVMIRNGKLLSAVQKVGIGFASSFSRWFNADEKAPAVNTTRGGRARFPDPRSREEQPAQAGQSLAALAAAE